MNIQKKWGRLNNIHDLKFTTSESENNINKKHSKTHISYETNEIKGGH